MRCYPGSRDQNLGYGTRSVRRVMALECRFSANPFKRFRHCVPLPPPLEEAGWTAAMPLFTTFASLLLLLPLTSAAGLRVGDAMNLLVLANTAAFTAALLAHAAGLLDAGFSPSFLSDGFCVANKATPWLQSHALCFYVDTAGALALALLCWRRPLPKGLAILERSARGVFAHGAAHLGLWYFSPAEPPSSAQLASHGWLKLALASAGLGLFFFLLLRTAPTIPRSHAALHAAFHGVALACVVPTAFDFSYVNTVLMTLVVLYEMLTAQQKDEAYDLAAVIVHFPVTQLAWAEGFSCDRYMKHIGGHVWYDAVIPASLCVYAAVVLSRQPRSGKLA